MSLSSEQIQLSVFLTFILAPAVVHSSWGDKQYRFQDCLYTCTNDCGLDRYPGILPLYLTLFGWTCEDECKYNCMHKVTKQDVKSKAPIKQFYGKWPFVRFLGIQEPASVTFSIMNGLGHILGWQQYKSLIPSSYRMYSVWRGLFLVSVNAWLWSSVFHSRDLLWTERLDYFCATSLVLYSVFAFFVRAFGAEQQWRYHGYFGVIILKHVPSHWVCTGISGLMALIPASIHIFSLLHSSLETAVEEREEIPRKWFFAFIAMTLFCCHVTYLSLWKFDYGYNIKANVAVGVINLCGWLFWCLKNRSKQPYVWKCALTTVSVFLLMGLEVGDFPPIWWTFDAHSLWHLGTAPFCYFWYRCVWIIVWCFLIDDAKFELQEDKVKKEE